MIKIVSASEMGHLESKAYAQGHREEDFMENAGYGISMAAQNFIETHQLQHIIWLLCGKGNNGGDAFVAGRYLLKKDYQVTAIQMDELDQCSPLCQRNAILFTNQGGKIICNCDFHPSEGIIIDGLFGTGFKGTLVPPYSILVKNANESSLPILSVDIASGLNGTTGEQSPDCIQATETLFLELPKLGCFLQNGWNMTGQLRQIKFGLPSTILEQYTTEFALIDSCMANSFIPKIIRNRHKYQTGMVVGLAGSPEMPGAALLSSLAALRTGSGLVKLLHPFGMENQLACSPYELIKIPYSMQNKIDLVTHIQKATAIFVGPGLGRKPEQHHLLQEVIPQLTKPCVIDADALTLFAEQNFILPHDTIFTPHHGEMQRLLHIDNLSLNLKFLHQCRQYAIQHQITLVLKGAPTFIFHPDKPTFLNCRGDPGMATAGSGDVLTGIITSLLSQGLSCHHAAITAVYLHGIAGELAVAQRKTSYGLIASDLINSLASAYMQMKIEHDDAKHLSHNLAFN